MLLVATAIPEVIPPPLILHQDPVLDLETLLLLFPENIFCKYGCLPRMQISNIFDHAYLSVHLSRLQVINHSKNFIFSSDTSPSRLVPRFFSFNVGFHLVLQNIFFLGGGGFQPRSIQESVVFKLPDQQ